MRKFFEIVGAITVNLCNELIYFVKVNMRYTALIIEIALPYIMYIIGQKVSIKRGGISIGAEIFIPIACTVIIYYIRELANKYGKGNKIPVPHKRFTEVSEDGEVTVRKERLQELILYLADLEDFMERKKWI